MPTHNAEPQLSDISNWWWSEEDATAYFGCRLSITFGCAIEAANCDHATASGGLVVHIRSVLGYHLAPELIGLVVERVGIWFLTDPHGLRHARYRRIDRDYGAVLAATQNRD
ncbi:hypothetical protein [Litorivicinus lipolyticus]|uniref:hypothetical protein n=1 Tax=Litorivicinus lipolyticus TaxID=418701 RepID=UPI003B5985F4